MGTNYYFYSAGGNDEVPLHIGKSSSGWCFGLHVYPDDGINGLDDWLRFFDMMDGKILDEYDREVAVLQLLSVIRERGEDGPDEYLWSRKRLGGFYGNWEEFHQQNHSEHGPRGLARCKIESHGNYRQSFTNGCVGHGTGTWDLIVGEFS